MNKASLLSQLKIDREAPAIGRERRNIWPFVGGALALAIVIAAVAWFAIARPDLTAVQTAQAKAVSSAAVAKGGSLLDASGYVVARRQATVSSKITGKVIQVLIEEGEHVTAGQVIARLDDSNARASVAQAQAEIGQANASVSMAQVALAHSDAKSQRFAALGGRGVVSTQAIDDARNEFDSAKSNLEVARSQVAVSKTRLDIAQRALDDTVVRAPFAGVVTVKVAQPGEMVSPASAGGFTRTGIGTIVDMDSLEVQVDVAESFINRVSQGMPASVKLNAYPDWEIPAQVIAVVPTADRSKATVSVRVGFKVKDPRIVTEMGAHVAFLSPNPGAASAGAASRSVYVPADAVQTEDGGQAVAFVVVGRHVERRAVRLGDKTTEGQMVVAGLAPGDAVVVEGGEHLKDGAGVKVTKKASSTR